MYWTSFPGILEVQASSGVVWPQESRLLKKSSELAVAGRLYLLQLHT